jgi:hypothetical protein
MKKSQRYLCITMSSPATNLNGAELVNFYLLILVSIIEFHVTYSLHFSRVREFFFTIKT